MRLTQAWNAFALVRAIIAIENGAPPSAWVHCPEWYSIHDHLFAMRSTGRWADQL
jgi:hypothetical protein